ncbi:hypothetical protein AbraCBS73388_008997, partial [Aspergillus brasiliensis]
INIGSISQKPCRLCPQRPEVQKTNILCMSHYSIRLTSILQTGWHHTFMIHNQLLSFKPKVSTERRWLYKIEARSLCSLYWSHHR